MSIGLSKNVLTLGLSQTHLQEAGHVADSPDPRGKADGFTRAGGQCQERLLLSRDSVSDPDVLPAAVKPDVPHPGQDVEGERPGHGGPAGLARVGDDGLVAACEELTQLSSLWRQ